MLVNERIEPIQPIEAIAAEPLGLPEGFMWSEPDITNDAEVEAVYTLLNANYVEDDDNMFRFDYSKEFLKWALLPPGWRRDWHVAVRTKSGAMVAFISAVPAHVALHHEEDRVVEINFLCVHKKLRAKRLAPVLIREITRRVNRTGIFEAVYTAGAVLPKPVSVARYYHRSINIKKLVEVGFSHLNSRLTMARAIKLYKTPPKTSIPGLRPMRESDVPAVTALLGAYLGKFKMHPIFHEDDVAHTFLPRPRVVYTYVVENANHQITDMLSFYDLSSTIIGNKNYQTLRAAYSFYNVANSVPLVKLMDDALTIAGLVRERCARALCECLLTFFLGGL